MPHSILELIGKLKAARPKKGWSQRAFSESIGMPQSRLSRIETGVVDLQTSNLMELADSLGIHVPEIDLIPIGNISGLPEDIREMKGQAFIIKRFDRTDTGAAGNGVGKTVGLIAFLPVIRFSYRHWKAESFSPGWKRRALCGIVKKIAPASPLKN
jgi:transcriptional regulator with XRE-family HTH domain